MSILKLFLINFLKFKWSIMILQKNWIQLLMLLIHNYNMWEALLKQFQRKEEILSIINQTNGLKNLE